MTTTTPTPLERAFQRYGDDLYRLALLLTSDEARAAALLRGAMLSMVDTPPAELAEITLVAALVAALPLEHRRLWRRGTPRWARLPASRAEAPLIIALALLPRQQRLALGLTVLQGFDAAQAARVLGGDERRVRTLTRDALRALAPSVRPALTLADLDVEGAPADCRHTRAALALRGDLSQADPATRGHLALCEDCRAVEQTWQRLGAAVETGLRGALREVACPAQLHDDVRASLARTPAHTPATLLASRQMRLVLVAAAVLLLIALLVLPRRREPPLNAGGATAHAAATAPRELAQRALDQLYAPPAGSGVWHGRWEIRWSFVAGSYAALNAETWVDTATDRHRLQLVHSDGGGPFEFELADETGNLWYAVAPTYAPSLYPTLSERENLRARLRLAPGDQQGMLRARLESGAWGIAAIYLRQALAARELRSWGRQRAGDTTLEVIGFDGVSPLLPPSDAPDSTVFPTTILLSIDTQSGALYEVRELIGPEGSERSTRTTWRFVQGEWLSGQSAITAAFDLRRAWNGAGDFDRRLDAAADPALPLDAVTQVTSLAQMVQSNPAFRLPAAPPPGATRAVLLAAPDSAAISITYIGTSRRLEIRTDTNTNSARPRLARGERLTLNGQQIVIQPVNAQGYRAQLSYRGPYDQQIQTWIGAIGYTRAELIEVLRGFVPVSPESYRAQAALFADPHPRDQATFAALLGALAAPAPPAGGARHFVERTFTRHSPAPDPLHDPYHLPPYGGRPEELLVENWARLDDRGGGESGSFERGADGTIYARQYLGPDVTWYYDAPHSQANRFHTSELPLVNRINLDQGIVLDLLARGGSRLSSLPDGTRVISHSQPLLETHYADVLQQQQRDPDAGGPYLGDISSDVSVTTWIYLGIDGRAKRIETRVSAVCATIAFSGSGAATPCISYPTVSAHTGILLESWELIDEEQIPTGRVPAQTFDPTPPDALSLWDAVSSQSLTALSDPGTTTITAAVALARTPLFVLEDAGQIGAPLVEVGMPPSNIGSWGNNVFEGALQRGLATRLTYWMPSDGPLQRTLPIYQGDATTFGAYIRARATSSWRWQHSEPVRLTIGERSVDGWSLALADGTTWTLFEIDGTLLATQANIASEQATLARLRRLPRP